MHKIVSIKYMHSVNNNICGGYTSVGCRKEFQNAFIFNIRSSNEYEPKLSYPKDNHVTQALRYYYNNDASLMFGGLDLNLYSWNEGTVKVFANGSSRYYQSFPNKHHFLGQYSDPLKAIQMFQFN